MTGAYGLSLRLLQGLLRKCLFCWCWIGYYFINVNYIRLIHNAIQFIYILTDFLLIACCVSSQIGDENSNYNSGFIYFSVKVLSVFIISYFDVVLLRHICILSHYICWELTFIILEACLNPKLFSLIWSQLYLKLIKPYLFFLLISTSKIFLSVPLLLVWVFILKVDCF